jgi:hypothetical protein
LENDMTKQARVKRYGRDFRAAIVAAGATEQRVSMFRFMKAHYRAQRRRFN